MPGAAALPINSISLPAAPSAPPRREAWASAQPAELAPPEPEAALTADIEAGHVQPQPAAAPAQPSFAAEACKCLARAVGGTLCLLGSAGYCGASVGAAVYGVTYGIAYAAFHDKDVAGLFAFYFGSLGAGAGTIVGCAGACHHLSDDPA